MWKFFKERWGITAVLASGVVATIVGANFFVNWILAPVVGLVFAAVILLLIARVFGFTVFMGRKQNK